MCLVHRTKVVEYRFVDLYRGRAMLWQINERHRRLMPFQPLLQYHCAAREVKNVR